MGRLKSDQTRISIEVSKRIFQKLCVKAEQSGTTVEDLAKILLEATVGVTPTGDLFSAAPPAVDGKSFQNAVPATVAQLREAVVVDLAGATTKPPPESPPPAPAAPVAPAGRKR